MINKIAKILVSLLNKIGWIPVGSYGRDSHQNEYKDLDFLSLKPFNSSELDKVLPYYTIIKKGNKYAQIKLLNRYIVDVWFTNEKNFYKDYLTRTLKKEKVIYLNKLIHLNSLKSPLISP